MIDTGNSKDHRKELKIRPVLVFLVFLVLNDFQSRLLDNYNYCDSCLVFF